MTTPQNDILIIWNTSTDIMERVPIDKDTKLRFGYNNTERSASMYVVNGGNVKAHVSNVLNHVLLYENCSLDFIMTTEINGINYLYPNVNNIKQKFVVKETLTDCEFQIWKGCTLEMGYNNLLNTVGSYITSNL